MLALVATDVVLEEYQAALAKAEGLPRRGKVVGGPDYLPKVYAPKAAGWTDRVVDVITTSDNRRALPVPISARIHLGKVVRVGNKNVTLPALATMVEVTRKPDVVHVR